jgi:hypothetical protein
MPLQKFKWIAFSVKNVFESRQLNYTLSGHLRPNKPKLKGIHPLLLGNFNHATR